MDAGLIVYLDMHLEMIKSQKDYEEALMLFERVLQAKPGTPESDEADRLAALIKEYEDRYFIISHPGN